MKRDLISLENYTSDDIKALLDLGRQLKSSKGKRSNELSDKSIGLIFQKPSNRTRVSFEVGIWQLGGNCIYLGPDEIDLGKRETTEDAAKTLSRYLDGLVARTFSHQDVIDLGKHATIPVINGLSDLFHPCQALADLLTVKEKFDDLKGLTLSYIGDGNNVCHSLLLACSKMGMSMSVATPKGYEPNPQIVAQAKKIANDNAQEILITDSPHAAVKDAHVIYTDVWTSMGQEEEAKKRLKAFKGFQINYELLNLADSNHIFMHCLPAHRGEEVTAEVIDGKHSVVFDQAENRLHIQKAVLIFLNKGISGA